MSGEREFVFLSTLGRGSIPYLPPEIRISIFENTFPRVLFTCKRCDEPLLLSSFQHKFLVESRPYTRIGEEFVCVACIQSYRVTRNVKRRVQRGIGIYLMYKAFYFVILSLDALLALWWIQRFGNQESTKR